MKTTTMNQPFCTTLGVSEQQSEDTAFKRTRDTLKRYAVRWGRRYRLRQSLYEMDTQLIEKDIGVPHGSLSEEAYKPFWRE